MSLDTGHISLIVSAKVDDELKHIAYGLTTLNHQAAIELHEHLTAALHARAVSDAEKPWTVPSETVDK